MGFYYSDLIQNNRYTFRLLARKMNDNGTFADNEYVVIARDFIRDPLTVNIAHNWGGLGQNLATQFTDFLTGIFKQYQETMDAWEFYKQFGSTGEYSSFAFSQYVSASDFIKTFKGTEVSIPLNLTVKFFARNKNISVTEQVGNLLKYLIGSESLPAQEELNKLGIGENGMPKYLKLANYVREIKAPHGYDSVQASFTELVKGSMHLHYGSSMAIDNLLLTNVNLMFSKETDLWGEPLYAEIVMSLTPARMFSITELKALVNITAQSHERIYLRT